MDKVCVMRWIAACFRNYAGFRGRARRREFWYFTLFAFALLVVARILDVLAFGYGGGSLLISTVVLLVLFLPHLSVAVRRLHDVGRSGWWMAGYVVLLVAGRFYGERHAFSTFEVVVVLTAGIYLVFLLFSFLSSGDRGDNDYGPSPRHANPAGER